MSGRPADDHAALWDVYMNRSTGDQGIQEGRYEFPYHYLPSSDGRTISVHRHLSWGLEYVTYTSFISTLVAERQPKSLLDVGCGDGRFIHLVKHIVPVLTGVDVSTRAIGFARAFNPEIKFIEGGVDRISQRHHAITLVEVLEHIPDKEYSQFTANLSQCLYDDGFLIVSVPTINRPVHPKHFRHYSLDSLISSMHPHFRLERGWWLYRLGPLEQVLKKCLCNSWFILNSPYWRAWIWRIHKRWTYFADSTTGTHLVCLLRGAM